MLLGITFVLSKHYSDHLTARLTSFLSVKPLAVNSKVNRPEQEL